MNNKKVKKLISCICAGSLLLGTIPTNGLVASAAATEKGVTFCDTTGNELEEAKYSLHGVSYDAEEGVFVRMPLEEATKICGKDSVFNKSGVWSLSIYSLAREASGGRIRFNTNSPTITIEAELYTWDAEHVDHGGKSMIGAKYGFDIYEDTAEGSTYVDTVIAETKDENGDGKIDPGSVYISQTIELGDAKERDLTLYFPVVIETRNVKISVAEGSTVKEHVNDYDGNGRIVVYGNSITQGGCATKPGSTYVNTVARNVNMDFLNLGVWGSCKGQPEFAEYIASIDDMSMLIIDYDGNQSLASVLGETHYPFYEIVRAAHPDIPIIVLTRASNRMEVSNAGYPDKYSTTAEMKAVIRQTYEIAKAAGDKNIHFVDGATYFGYSKTYMADNAHPDAIGQAKMADVVTAAVQEVLAGAENLCVEPSSCKEPTFVIEEDFSGVADGTTKPKGWKTASNAIKENSGNWHIITKTDGDVAYQMEFTKGTSSAVVTFAPEENVWNGEMNLGVELDAELHIVDGVIPTFGVKIGESPNNKANQKYEVRIVVTEEDYTVSFWDGTPGESNPTKAAKSTSVVDQSFIKMYKEGKVSFNLRINQTPTIRDGEEVLALDVYINDMLVAGYNLKPHEGFEPNSFKLFAYGAGTNNVSVNKVVVDNIKAFVTTKHSLSFVETEGMREHYVCSECGKKFLDEKAILNVTDADLIILDKCVDMLFSDDFEDVEQSEANWTEARTNYPNDGEAGIFGIVEEDGNHMYQLLTTRDDKSVSNNISINDSILTGYPDYTVEAKGVVYKSGSQWPTWSVRLRNPSALGYEVQVLPSASGYKIIVRDRTSTTNTQDPITTVIADKDGDLATQMAAGKVSFDVRVDIKRVAGENNTGKAIFTVYVDDNEPTVTTMTLGDPSINVTKAYFYLHTGSTKGLTYKGAVDNVKIYTTSHEISPVEGTTSTESEAGMKAHYACRECGKKFADAEGKTVVTDAQLAYAKLLDIKCQTAQNASNPENTDIRFVVYVDDYQKYQNVTFKITCSAGTGTAVCKDVYTGVYAGGELYTTDDIYSVEGYFATFILRNNTEEDLTDPLTVTVTWTALDGTTKTTTRVVNIAEKQ